MIGTPPFGCTRSRSWGSGVPDPSAIQDASELKHIFWMCYGDPGVEKTRRLVGKLPGSALIIRPPTGHIDAMDPADLRRHKQWKVNDWDDMTQAEDYLREKGGKWDWVVVEDLSLLQDHLLDDELETEISQISRNPKRALFGPDEGVYGRNFYKLASWFRHIIGPDLFNLLVICHVSNLPLPSPDKDAEGDPIPKLMPWVQGKNMSSKICGYMKMVTLLADDPKEDGAKQLLTRSNQYFYAKDVFHIAPKGVLKDPTSEKIISLIEKRRASRPAPAASSRGVRTSTTKPAAKRVIRRGGGR
jgi:hypothetical protein